MAVAPDFAGTIWAAAGPTAWSSRDGGYRWRRVLGARGGSGIAFTEASALLVGLAGSQRADFGGTLAGPVRATPASFVALATPYHKTSRLYALDRNGRLWLSVDAGLHWSPLVARGLPAGCSAVAAVRGDVIQPDTILAACGGAGLWRSADFGATFRHVAGIADARSVAMTTDDQRRVLVAGTDGIHLSTDGGRTFRLASPAVASAVAIDSRNWRLAYAASGGRLLRSIDGGATWPSAG